MGSFFEPYLGVSMLRSQLDGYQESGAGILDIHYGNETQNLTTVEAGVRVGTEVPVGNVAFVPWAKLGGTGYSGDRTVNNTSIWVRDFGRDYFNKLLYSQAPGENSVANTV